MAILLGRDVLHRHVEQRRAYRSDQFHFRCYHNAAKCYVYLSDLSGDEGEKRRNALRSVEVDF